MKNVLKKLPSLIHSHHKTIVLISVLITICNTFLIFRIDIKTDILDFFPANNQFIGKFVNFLEDFGSIDNLVVVLESKENRVDNHIEFVEDLVETLKGTSFIEDIDYNIFRSKGEIFLKHFPLYIDTKKGFDLLKERVTKKGINTQIIRNNHLLISPFSSPIDTMLISKDPLNLRAIIKDQFMKKGEQELAFKGGYYISKDNSTLLILVKPAGSSKNIGFMQEMKGTLDAIISNAKVEYPGGKDLRISYTGAYAQVQEAQETIKNDIFYSFVISGVLIILLFQAIYKAKPLVLVIIVFTLFTSLSWTLGFAYLIFGGLNIISSIVSAMLLGLGMDYIIHIFVRYETEFTKQKDSQLAIETTLSKTGVRVVASAFTTTAAFLSGIVTSFKGLHQLGIIAGLGILISLFITLVVMTSLLVWIGNIKAHLLFQKQGTSLGTIWINKQITDHCKSILIIGIVLSCLSVFGFFNVEFDTSPENMGVKNSLSQKIESRVSKKFGKQKNPLIILAKKKTPEELFLLFDRISHKLDRWERENLIQSYTSIGIFVPPPSKQKRALNFLRQIRQTNEIKIDNLDTIFLDALNKNDFIADEYSKKYILGIQKVLHIDKPLTFTDITDKANKKIKYFLNNDKVEIASYIFPQDGIWDEDTLTTIKKDIADLSGGATDKEIYLLGSNLIFKELKGTIILESFAASIIAGILVFGILYLQFKTIKRVALAVLPLSLGLFYTVGFMGILNIPFNYINIGAVSLLFGIGVDYGIYILGGYFEDHKPDLDRTILKIGRSVIICGITTIIGFGSLITMRFGGIASLGQVICLGVIFCLFTSLFLLPSILHIFKQRL